MKGHIAAVTYQIRLRILSPCWIFLMLHSELGDIPPKLPFTLVGIWFSGPPPPPSPYPKPHLDWFHLFFWSSQVYPTFRETDHTTSVTISCVYPLHACSACWSLLLPWLQHNLCFLDLVLDLDCYFVNIWENNRGNAVRGLVNVYGCT